MQTISSIFKDPFRGILTLSTAASLLERLVGERLKPYIDLKGFDAKMGSTLNFWSLQEIFDHGVNVTIDLSNYSEGKPIKQIPTSRWKEGHLALKTLMKIAKIVAASLSINSFLHSIHAIETQRPIWGPIEDVTRTMGHVGSTYFTFINREEETNPLLKKGHYTNSMFSLTGSVALLAMSSLSFASRFAPFKKFLLGRLDEVQFSLNVVAVTSMLAEHFYDFDSLKKTHDPQPN